MAFKTNEGLHAIKKQVGSIKELSKLMNVNPSTLGSWMRGWRKLPAERIPQLIEISGGTVTAEQLRPDIFNNSMLLRT